MLRIIIKKEANMGFEYFGKALYVPTFKVRVDRFNKQTQRNAKFKLSCRHNAAST